MKTVKYLFTIMLLALGMTVLNACSSDDTDPVDTPVDGTAKVDKVNPRLIYKAGLPKSIDGSAVKVDSKNRISAIGDMTFSYIVRDDKSAEPDVIVKYRNMEAFKIWLNDKGVAEHITSDSENFIFSYNDDLTLNKFTSVIKEDLETFTSETVLTYSQGNISGFWEESDEGSNNGKIRYSGIDNLGGYPVMFSDEMAMIALTGLCGRTTAKLPEKALVYAEYYHGLVNEYYEIRFSYKFNPAGLPLSVTRSYIYEDEDENESDTMTFTW